jgi:hypothetical protein
MLNGKGSLEEAFAEICQQDVISKMKETNKDEPKTPRDFLLLIRQKETMQKLLYLIVS